MDGLTKVEAYEDIVVEIEDFLNNLKDIMEGLLDIQETFNDSMENDEVSNNQNFRFLKMIKDLSEVYQEAEGYKKRIEYRIEEIIYYLNLTT